MLLAAVCTGIESRRPRASADPWSALSVSSEQPFVPFIIRCCQLVDKKTTASGGINELPPSDLAFFGCDWGVLT
jgi:hypothetical protein